MATRTSALTPLQAAIATRLEGDVPLAGELASVVGVGPPAIPAIFSLGTVPKDQPTAFLEIGDSAETSFSTFNKGGNRNVEGITIVSPRADGKMRVARIYAHLVRLLETVPLVVAGHVVALARVEIVTIYSDPNGTDLRGIVRLTVESLNG